MSCGAARSSGARWLNALLLAATLAAIPAEAWRGVPADPHPDADHDPSLSAQDDEEARGGGNAEFVADDYEYCLVCHGSVGQGNSVLEAPVLAGMEPWSLRNQLQAFREGWRGRDERDLPGREMYPMAMSLDANEIEAVIDYVAALPPLPVSTLPSRQTPDEAGEGDPEAGSGLFSRCISCHGRDAGGIVEMQAPALAYQDPAYLRRQLAYFRDGVRGAAEGDLRGARMADAAGGLTDTQIRDVVSYIASLRP